MINDLEFLKIDNNAKNAVCLLHGYGASMQDLYGLGEFYKTQHKFDYFFPNGPLEVPIGPMMSGRAWFPIDMDELNRALSSGTHRSFEEYKSVEFNQSMDMAQKFIEKLIGEYDNVIIGGFSQGAMISTHLSLKLSDKIKGLICYSGSLIDKSNLIEKLETSDKFPFLQSHGKSDQVLAYDAAKNLFELLKLGGHEGEFIPFDGGHEIPMNVLEKTQRFLDRII